MVILFSYLSLGCLQPLEVVSQSKMLAEDFEVGLRDANDLNVMGNNLLTYLRIFG